MSAGDLPKGITQNFVFSSSGRAPAPGLRVELTPIPGHTPPSVLDRGETLVFPAVLNEVAIQEQQNFGDYDSVGAGSFSVRRGGDDDARSLSSFGLEVYANSGAHLPFLQGGAPVSWSVLRRKLRKISNARFPVHVRGQVIVGAERMLGGRGAFGDPNQSLYLFSEELVDELDVNQHVTIRGLTRTLKPGEPENRYFSLDLTEWRDATEGRTAGGYGATAHGPRAHLPVRVTVKPGQSLWDLASIYYGKGSLFPVITSDSALLRRVPPHQSLLSWNPPIKSVVIPALGELKAV